MNALRKIGIFTALVFCAGTASANPILVDPALQGSSAEADVVECFIGDCGIQTRLARASLNREGRMMDVGDEWTFNFFRIRAQGSGIGSAVVEATLAFLAPDISATSTGFGGYASIAGIITAGVLVWDDIAPFDLGDGSALIVSFENFIDFGTTQSRMVKATVRRVSTAVPAPGTLALFGLGLFAAAAARRRRTV